MNNLSSYCGLVEAKRRASDKYLYVKQIMPYLRTITIRLRGGNIDSIETLEYQICN
jgi:hypothetical protein